MTNLYPTSTAAGSGLKAQDSLGFRFQDSLGLRAEDSLGFGV